MIEKISLENFRNFEKRSFDFSDKITVIVGDNASGKTNIIEGLVMLSTGKSFKAGLQEEVIGYGEEIAKVKGEVSEKLEVQITRGVMGNGATQKKVPRKRLLVNGVGKRMIDFSGIFKTVLFVPRDLDIVLAPPSRRRDFLDTVLSQVDREYRRALVSYEKGLRSRNKLLFRIREEGIPRSHLMFWDKLLIKNGEYITKAREDFINFVNEKKELGDRVFEIFYDESIISEKRLAEYGREEIYAGKTLVGPHRDDFIFKIQNSKLKIQNKRELARFGSRGEQRMGVLWLKIAELRFIESETNEKPTLLLDDIFSELDHEHRDMVMEVSKRQQTVVTAADPHFVEKEKGVEIINL